MLVAANKETPPHHPLYPSFYLQIEDGAVTEGVVNAGGGQRCCHGFGLVKLVVEKEIQGFLGL